MNDSPTMTLPNTMSREEFSAAWQEHLKTYGPNKQTAGAKSEQHMSDLFARSGWTQDQIAGVVGMSFQHVSRMLNFGAFLVNSPAGESSNLALLKRPLTENRFRSFWKQTGAHKGNDRQRFRATWQLILAADQDEAAGGGRKPARDHEPIRTALGQRFSDGKWHAVEVMADRLGESAKDIHDAIAGAKKFNLKHKGEGYPFEIESKPVGTSVKYRMFKLDRQISLHKVEEELAPIIEGLMIEGKKSPVATSPGTVASLAIQIRKLLEKWGE